MVNRATLLQLIRISFLDVCIVGLSGMYLRTDFKMFYVQLKTLLRLNLFIINVFALQK